MDEPAAAAGRLRGYVDRVDRLLIVLGDGAVLTAREQDVVRALHTTLKAAFKADLARNASARGRAALTDAERHVLQPAVGRALAALRMPIGRDPVRYGLRAELAAARDELRCFLTRLAPGTECG